MKYQVILFFLHVVMIHLGLCFFLYCNWDLGVTVHLYQLNHFCNLKLTFLIYKLFYMSCVNLCQICRVFLFYHNLFIFITICMFFFYHQYILVYFFTAWQERELKMPDLLPLRGGRWEQCLGWKLRKLNRPNKIAKMLPPRGGWQGQVVKYQEKFNKRRCSKQV